MYITEYYVGVKRIHELLCDMKKNLKTKSMKKIKVQNGIIVDSIHFFFNSVHFLKSIHNVCVFKEHIRKTIDKTDKTKI